MHLHHLPLWLKCQTPAWLHCCRCMGYCEQPGMGWTCDLNISPCRLCLVASRVPLLASLMSLLPASIRLPLSFFLPGSTPFPFFVHSLSFPFLFGFCFRCFPCPALVISPPRPRRPHCCPILPDSSRTECIFRPRFPHSPAWGRPRLRRILLIRPAIPRPPLPPTSSPGPSKLSPMARPASTSTVLPQLSPADYQVPIRRTSQSASSSASSSPSSSSARVPSYTYTETP